MAAFTGVNNDLAMTWHGWIVSPVEDRSARKKHP
jgi:hypothetical protein